MGVSRADDHRRHRRLVEHGTQRDSADCGAVRIRHVAHGAQQLLKRRPAAELVDNQLVLVQRTILKRGHGFRRRQPAFVKKSAR